jgi:aminopeptidase N
LEGIKEFNEEKDEEIYLQCIQILLESTKESKDYFVISKAVTGLGKFLRSKIHQNSVNVQQVQVKVLERLKELLRSDRRRIKINACEALSDENAKFLDLPDTHTLGTLQALMEIAKSDIDGFVRRQAEVCANSIKEWIADWSKKPLIIDNGENNKEINRN